MAAERIDGKAIAAQIRVELAQEVVAFQQQHGCRPHLAAVLVGQDPASETYVRNKQIACEQAGFQSTLHRLPATCPQSALLDLIRELNKDRQVHGILVQMPLPAHLDETAIIAAVDPDKDVDGFHPYNLGRLIQGNCPFPSCTPAGIVELLTRAGSAPAGKHVVIVGRSLTVGKPLALLLSQKGAQADATVTLCHSRTVHLEDHTRRADILVAAIGQPQFVRGTMLTETTVVIDVGINRLDSGQLVGDVHFEEAVAKVRAITPVPGGVGPMTVAMLLRNTLTAAKHATAKT